MKALSRNLSFEVYSIFGQIEKVVAECMIEEGVATKIHFNQIPASAAFNEHGQRAHFAIVIPRELIPAFEERIKNIRM